MWDNQGVLLELPKVRIQIGEPKWEVQTNDGRYLTWYSHQMHKRDAVKMGRDMRLKEGHGLRVVHVGTGEVALER